MNADDAPKIRIMVTAGPEAGRTIEIWEDRIRIGRHRECEIRLKGDTTVSDYHANMVWEDGEWFISDEDSTNGTYIDRKGERTAVEHSPLAPGQMVFLGSTQFHFECDDPGTLKTEPLAAQAQQTRAATTALRISLDEQGLAYEISSAMPVANVYRTPFVPGDMEVLARRVGELVAATHSRQIFAGSRDESAIHEQMQRLGQLLDNRLIPQRLRMHLEEGCEGGLFLIHDPALISIPWELVVLGTKPWCLHFNLSRQLVIEGHSIHRVKRANEEAIRVLFVVNPTEDLPECQEAGETLFQDLLELATDVEFEFLAGHRATRMEVSMRLEEAHIVYYNGHGEFEKDAPSESGWRLYDGRLTCADIGRLRHPPAFVFANACESGREGEMGEGPDASPSGMATGFLMAGVANYLGSAWPVSAETSTLFAASFIQRLLSGEAIGEAVRLARVQLWEEFGASDLCWASYVLYGHPGRRTSDY